MTGTFANMARIKEFNHKTRAIFIHVPKVAGISIESALFGEKVGHSTALEYMEEDREIFFKYFTFGFVRSPYERLASAYFYLKSGGRNSIDKKWTEENLYNLSCLKYFVLALKDDQFRNKVMHQVHFRPQYQYLFDKSENQIVNFVGRYENLLFDFEIVTKKLNIKCSLDHKNKSEQHGNYNDYYNEETRGIIKEIYRKDFELLGYT